MMKHILIFVAITFALIGCRREDIREFTFEVPQMTKADQKQIVATLSKYNGVNKDSIEFDFNKNTIKLKYDSMQLAKTNIRMSVDEAINKRGK